MIQTTWGKNHLEYGGVTHNLPDALILNERGAPSLMARMHYRNESRAVVVVMKPVKASASFLITLVSSLRDEYPGVNIHSNFAVSGTLEIQNASLCLQETNVQVTPALRVDIRTIEMSIGAKKVKRQALDVLCFETPVLTITEESVYHNTRAGALALNLTPGQLVNQLRLMCVNSTPFVHNSKNILPAMQKGFVPRVCDDIEKFLSPPSPSSKPTFII